MKKYPHATLSALLLAGLMLSACDRSSQAPATASKPASSTDMMPRPDASGPDRAEPTPPAAPALQVTTLDGSAYDLADHRGQWVVINFWATWCAPCLKEMPELSALDAMHEHIEVIGLAYEQIDPEAMRAFLAGHPVVYPIAILDTYAPPTDFATPRGLPMTYLIAPDGHVAEQVIGPVTAADIEAAIAAAGGPDADPAAPPAERT